MNDPKYDKLDELLRTRRLEPASANLAQRIIFKARQRAQQPTLSLWQWLCQLCAELHMPRPAYMLAGALLLGMAIGFSAPQNAELTTDESGATIHNFLSADEALL